MKNKELEISGLGQNLLRIIPPYPSPKVHMKSNKSQPKLCGYCGEHVIPTKNETFDLNAKKNWKWGFFLQDPGMLLSFGSWWPSQASDSQHLGGPYPKTKFINSITDLTFLNISFLY